MHNSGTSLAGALLHASGVPMGKRLLFREKIEAAKRPRYDYFEDQDVVALQEKHLLRVQRHWSSYRASFELPDPFSNERRTSDENYPLSSANACDVKRCGSSKIRGQPFF